MNKARVIAAAAGASVVVCLVFAAVAFADPIPTRAIVERSFQLMGSHLDVTIEAENREAAMEGSERVLAAVTAADARLSTWRPTTELSRLNSAPVGLEMPLSDTLRGELLKVTEYARTTDYAFSPWVGPLIDAWKIRSGKPKRPSPSQQRAALLASAPGAFTLQPEPGPRLVRERAGARIEEGGFGKGAALDDALDALRGIKIAAAVLNFGGQVSVMGRTAPIEIADPVHRDQALLSFEAQAGESASGLSASTSSQSTQPGHILDPRTGGRAEFSGSATVVAPSGIEADSLSTALFVMGPEAGLRWANSHQTRALWLIPSHRDPSGARWAVVTSRAWSAPIRKLSTNLTSSAGVLK
jgi:thiamine biosynthesis lipoprotein